MHATTYRLLLHTSQEIFVFVSMGASPSMIEITLLSHDLPIDTFDIMHARCHKASDQERLITTVEAATAGLDGFNQYVRGILEAAKPLRLAKLDGSPQVQRQSSRILSSKPTPKPGSRRRRSTMEIDDIP